MQIHFLRDVLVVVASLDLKVPNIYEGVIDASVNTCCKLKLVFLEKRL